MAITVSINTVVSVMEKKKMPFWSVYDDKTKINSNSEDKNVKTSAAELTEFVNQLNGNFIDIVISSKTGEELGAGGDIKSSVLRYTVALNKETKAIEQGTSTKEMIALITENVSLKFQNEIDRLKALVAEYEEEGTIGEVDQTPVEKILDSILPHAPAIIGKILNIGIPPVKASVLGNIPEEKTETKAQHTPEEIAQFKKAAQAGKILHAVDPSFGDRLLGLAILAKFDKNTYTMAAGYLESMLNNLKQSNPEVKKMYGE